MTKDNDDHTLMKFPCTFPIKIVGHAHEDFEKTILNIIKQHAPEITETSLKSRQSSDGKYVSITATIEAASKTQLDAIYLDLTACKLVLMAL